MLLRLGALAVLGLCACTPKPAPASALPDAVGEHTEAQAPYCCATCSFNAGEGLSCEACSPSQEDACEGDKVDCGDKETVWDESARTVTCVHEPESNVDISGS